MPISLSIAHIHVIGQPEWDHVHGSHPCCCPVQTWPILNLNSICIRVASSSFVIGFSKFHISRGKCSIIEGLFFYLLFHQIPTKQGWTRKSTSVTSDFLTFPYSIPVGLWNAWLPSDQHWRCILGKKQWRGNNYFLSQVEIDSEKKITASAKRRLVKGRDCFRKAQWHCIEPKSGTDNWVPILALWLTVSVTLDKEHPLLGLFPHLKYGRVKRNVLFFFLHARTVHG